MNATGIAGAWDFAISYPRAGGRRGVFGIPPPGDDDRGVFDAVDQQLGLKLEFRDISQPVLVVDRAHEVSDTSTDVAKRLAAGPLAFEVATIKPCTGPNPLQYRPPSGYLLTTQCQSLDALIRTAWGFDNGPGSPRDQMVKPDWLASAYVEITARSSIAVAGPRDPHYMTMLRTLLDERFQIKSHSERRPRNVRVLVADNPKLKAADPSSRARCTRPVIGTVGSRIPIVLTCQNVTMAQFAEVVGSAGGQFYGTIDNTRLTGGWDLRVSWMTPAAAGLLRRGDNGPDVGTVSEPTGMASSLEEAIHQQLGLKLEVRRQSMPVVVIDHMRRTRTDN